MGPLRLRAGPPRDRSGRGPSFPSRLGKGTLCVVWLCLAGVLWGCRSRGEFHYDPARPYAQVATSIEYPDAASCGEDSLLSTPPPQTVTQQRQAEPWPMTLDEAIHIALTTSTVIRDAGGRLVRAPETVPTVYDPALAETDPRAGPEAALSAFDAQFTSGILWEKNDRAVRNLLMGGLSGLASTGFQQDYAAFKAEMTKTAATGTTFKLGNTIDYDLNNRLFNLFNPAYDSVLAAEVRHPLLQGSGIEFNRIAGPYARPGVYNGVVLARINTDISLAELETAVRDLLLEVERTYWRLYFAYRDLDAKTTARDSALKTWQLVNRKYKLGEADAEQESLARQQYFLFQLQVVDALGGREAGAALGGAGVYATERQLRKLLGLPASDGRLIRPADEPATVKLEFNWRSTLQEALCRRVELRRQGWLVKRRELELTASRHFLPARLDFLGQYRWRGLGTELLGDDSAFEQLFEGDYQEWQMGLQLNTPVGNRIGHLAVRNAELQLARERARFREVEREIVDEASGAFAELDRDYLAVGLTYNRAEAARKQLDDVRRKYLAGWSPLQFLLDAQARVAEAEVAHYRALVDYTQAIAELHRARGTLLEYYQVSLAEGPSSPRAILSAKKQSRRFAPKVINYTFVRPPPVSLGPLRQGPLPSDYPATGAAGPPPVRHRGAEAPEPVPLPAPVAP